MMHYRFTSKLPRAEYDQFIENAGMVCFTQDYAWCEVKSDWGHFHCGLYRDDVLVAVSLILVKKVVAGVRFFYAPHGYVIDFENKKDLAAMTEGIRRLAKLNHAYMVKCDPYFCINDNSFKDEEVEHLFSENYQSKHENLLACGYKRKQLSLEMAKDFQPRFNIFVPLCDTHKNPLSEEQLKKSCKNVKRYFGNYQEKRGVSFEITDDPARVDDFVSILQETEKRHSIKLRNKAYFEKLLAAFKGCAYMIFGKIDLDRYYDFLKNDSNATPEKLQEVTDLRAEKGSAMLLSTALIIMPKNRQGIRVGEYLYAGNDSHLSKLHVSAALVYECCKFALRNGCDYFNLGGVEGTLDDDLTKFKRNFNGRIMEFSGEYDLPTSPLYTPITLGYPAMVKMYKKIMKNKGNTD